MSRVIYTDTPATADQDALRAEHRLRPVADAEEGTGVNALPGGVFGYTYSPGLSNAPLWSVRRYRSYETHKLASGEVFVVGFSTAAQAKQLATGDSEFTLEVQPEPEPGADTLVTIPYSRIHQHRQHAAPNQHGFTVTVAANK